MRLLAIPTFRGPQRSRSIDQILTEVDELQAREIVLVAQDLAAYGRSGMGERSIIPLVRQIADQVDRVRLLYLYPSDLTDALIDTIYDTGVPYFDLSLQHVSSPLMRRMRRWGDGERFLRRITDIRAREPEVAFRSNFIVGYQERPRTITMRSSTSSSRCNSTGAASSPTRPRPAPLRWSSTARLILASR